MGSEWGPFGLNSDISPPWRLLALATFPRLPLLNLSFYALLAQLPQGLDNFEEPGQCDMDVIELLARIAVRFIPDYFPVLGKDHRWPQTSDMVQGRSFNN